MQTDRLSLSLKGVVNGSERDTYKHHQCRGNQPSGRELNLWLFGVLVKWVNIATDGVTVKEKQDDNEEE